MDGRQYEIIALIMRYWFVALVLLIFGRLFWEGIKKNKAELEEHLGHVLFFMVLLALSSFSLLSFFDSKVFDIKAAILGALISAILIFQYNFTKLLFPKFDRILLLTVDTLAILGFIMLQRLKPELAFRQVEWFALGNVALIIFGIFAKKLTPGKRISYALIVLSYILLILPLVLGKEIAGAKNWISLSDAFSIQPSEFVKIILIVVLAERLSKEKGFKDNLPIFAFVAMLVILVVLQRDLGAALLYFCIFMFMYYIATSDWIVILSAVGAASLGSLASYYLFSHVRVRIEAWKNPWADIENKGYQIAQSLIAISSGGLIGLGLGLGSPQMIPASRTDFIFSAICEEFGLIVGFCVIGFYLLIAIRGTRIALNAPSSYKALLAMGATVALVIQSFVIIGGVIKMIPLTGVTMPFVSYGGSSMVTSMAMIGILESIASDKNAEEDENEEDENENEDEELEPADEDENEKDGWDGFL